MRNTNTRTQIFIFDANMALIDIKWKVERECHDENVFLKADRALSKLNFILNLKS